MKAASDVDRRVRDLLAEYGAADLCLAEALCDRHAPDAVAFTIVEPDGSARDLRFADLAERSRRLATALEALGVGPGDRVATLMTKSADLVTAVLAIWRCGAVYVPLFTAFAAPAVEVRLAASDTKVTFADAGQRAKLGRTAGRVVVAGGAGLPGDLAFDDAVAGHEPQANPQRLGGDAPMIRLFTSGTTGDPKGVVVPSRALASFVVYQEFGLDVRPDDVFWNAADPGWAYGFYYAICAPLATGLRSLLLRAPFSPELTYDVLERYGVTNFAAAPTVYRALRAASRKPPSAGLALRRASSAGEPLGPDIVGWARTALGVPVHDHYGQTELGMAVVNGHNAALAAPLEPGSMGRAMPGFTVAILREDGTVADPGEVGRVAIELAGSPLVWFSAYADAPERTAERFAERGYYLTGDAGTMNADGYVFFSARDDDVIIMAGYRIGPFEIESVLHTHPAVAESAVVGMPDEMRGEVVEAFVVLRTGIEATPELAAQLQRHVKDGYAAHAYPRTIHFVAELPKTPSGKIQRFVLRSQKT